MSKILPYFTDTAYIAIINSLNISLKGFFQELIDLKFNQQIYATNAYAFRRRADENKGNLTLPFLNFKLKNIQEDNTLHNWQYTAEHSGIYVEELGMKLQIRPVAYQYECSFWCNLEDPDLHYAMSKIVVHGDDPNTVTFYPLYGSKVFPILGHLAWNGGPNMDSQYQENDWLVRNNIHNISMDFQIRSFIALAKLDISIPDEILFKFGVSQFGPDASKLSSQELYKLTVDHFSDTVSEAVDQGPVIPPVFP